MILSLEQIYAVAREAGFPSATAVKMAAIAMRESGGNSDAYNGTSATGDRSYGLWQINMYGPLAAARMQLFGLSSEDELFDPAVNAAAAYAIWNGNDANLARHWYIDRAGYREKYEQWLPAAQAAAARVDAMGSDPAAPASPGLFPLLQTLSSDFSAIAGQLPAADSSITAAALVVVGVAIALYIFD